MRFVSEGAISAGHPSLAGHFPGNPVLPGVVLLEEVLTALRAWQPNCRVDGFEVVKFRQPVRPGCAFLLELEQAAPNKISFRCTVEEQLLSSGIVTLNEQRECR